MMRLKKTSPYLRKSRKFGDVQPAEAGAKSAGRPSSAVQQLAESQPRSAALPLGDLGRTSAVQGTKARLASSRRKRLRRRRG